MYAKKDRKQSVVTSLFHREINSLRFDRRSNPCVQARMCIDDVVPRSALEGGNIFMGFTTCGRYLLSYTVRPSENFGSSSWSDLSFTYRLHFWLFTPFKEARKMSQVVLFDNNGVWDNNLIIEISQWQDDDSRLLVTGCSSNPDGDTHHSSFYATITTIPDLQSCPECRYILHDEVEDEIGDTRIRINCLRHGATVHLTFDLVSPFPKFDSQVQLKFKDSVFFNTGNVIHFLTLKLIEPLKQLAQTTPQRPLRCHFFNKNDTPDDDEEKSSDEVTKKPKLLERKFFKRNTTTTILTNTKPTKTAYDEITEDVLTDRNFTSFRKRKLADKKYEFNEDLLENIVPLLRKNNSAKSVRLGSESPRSDYARSPRTVISPAMSPDHSIPILRQLHNNYLSEEKKCNKRRRKLTIPCNAKVLRSYIQKDDDNISVMTDIEDEYFPVALPIDVHGGAYQQLQMFSSFKVDRCSGFVVQVLQRTLDIEMLCNEVANLICIEDEKHYWSCCDYDVAIVDGCSEKASITAVVVALIQATTVRKGGRSDRNYLHENRKKYEAVFYFEWEPSEDLCRVYDTGTLKELDTVPDPWHPTEHILALLKRQRGPETNDSNSLKNELAVQDWQSLEELTDARGLVTIYKNDCSDKKTDLRFSSPSSSITSSDDDSLI